MVIVYDNLQFVLYGVFKNFNCRSLQHRDVIRTYSELALFFANVSYKNDVLDVFAAKYYLDII